METTKLVSFSESSSPIVAFDVDEPVTMPPSRCASYRVGRMIDTEAPSPLRRVCFEDDIATAPSSPKAAQSPGPLLSPGPFPPVKKPTVVSVDTEAETMAPSTLDIVMTVGRMFFSEERAAVLARSPVTLLISSMFSTATTCLIASKAAPGLWSHACALSGKSKFLIGSCVALGGIVSLSIASAYAKWSHYMRPYQPPTGDFFHFHADPRAPKPTGVAGTLFDRAEGKWHVWPRPSIQTALDRAFCFTGMPLRMALHLDHTVGIEYPLVALGRLIKYYLGIDRKSATRSSLYFTAVNTSLACFIDYDEKSVTYGHAVVRDTLLQLNKNGMRLFQSIVFELDHDTQEMIGIRCTYRDASSLPDVTEVYGRVISTENTHPSLSDAAQVNQMAQLVCSVVANATHTMVHWFSNGTGLVDDKVWSTATLSTGITNWMNTSACAKSSSFIGAELSHQSQILLHNAANGLPMHGSASTGLTSLQGTVSSRSQMHRMAKAVRPRVVKHIEELPNIDEECRARHLRLVEAIVTATVLHSADHFYLWQGAGHVSEEILAQKTDMSGLLQCLVRPIAYKSIDLLVKDHRHSDPINMMIYEECAQIDRNFADNALSVGCAY